jgi:chromosome segregation protein
VSLDALQERRSGSARQVVDWLKSREPRYESAARSQLTVDKGWERAVETVLGSYLEAVCVDSIDGVAGMLDSLGAGTVTFFTPGDVSTSGSQGERLKAHVRGPAGLDVLFDGVIATTSLADALAVRPRLKPGQSVITRDGVWIGPDWLRVSRDRDAHEGVIEREQELRAERAALATRQREHRELESELDQRRESMRNLEDRLSQAQADVDARGQHHLNLRAELDGLRAKAEQRSSRLQQIVSHLRDLEAEIETAAAGQRAARQRLDEALAAMVELETRRQRLDAERESLRHDVAQARESAERERNAAREIEVRVESRRTGHESLLASVARLDGQMTRSSRAATTESQIATGEHGETQLRASLDTALGQRLGVEKSSPARRAMETVDAELGTSTSGMRPRNCASPTHATCSRTSSSRCRS